LQEQNVGEKMQKWEYFIIEILEKERNGFTELKDVLDKYGRWLGTCYCNQPIS
jgi:hypothetical protein